MKPKLSIIVPVYNVEEYLLKCIESILSQTFKEYELILVNDGSTDNSYRICMSYQKKDSRIKVINQENGGVSVARNAGLAVAKGDWIGFIDADDYIDSDFYSCLMEKTAIENVDIVCCGVKAVDDKGIEQPHLQCGCIPQNELFLCIEEAYIHFFHPSQRYLYWSPWDKIIRGNIAKKFVFEPGKKYAEDFYYCAQCIAQCRGIYYVPEKKYNYFLRPGSAIRSGKFDSSSFDTVYFAKKALEDIENNNCNIKIYAEMNLLIVSARTIRSYYQLADRKSEKYLSKIRNLQNLLRLASRRTKRHLRFSHRLLLIEAIYIPALFKLR